MKTEILDASIKFLFSEMHGKLKKAEQVARAALACADAGGTKEAVHISIYLDQVVFDVGRLHDAIMVLKVLRRRETGSSGDIYL